MTTMETMVQGSHNTTFPSIEPTHTITATSPSNALTVTKIAAVVVTDYHPIMPWLGHNITVTSIKPTHTMTAASPSNALTVTEIVTAVVTDTHPIMLWPEIPFPSTHRRLPMIPLIPVSPPSIIPLYSTRSERPVVFPQPTVTISSTRPGLPVVFPPPTIALSSTRPGLPVVFPPPPLPPPPPPPRKKEPDHNDELSVHPHCYNTGATINRREAVKGIDETCKELEKLPSLFKEGQTVPEEHIFFSTWNTAWDIPLHVYIHVRVKRGCEWHFDKDLCQLQFRRIVDECDTSSVARKQGGIIETDCLTWRFDPNVHFF